MRIGGTTVFPHAMAFGAAGDPAYSRYEGEVTARESRALGVHWIYYPVADVNNNPDNPIINIRSFGENPEAVAAQVTAFIEGAHADKKNYALATVKHFPGHGDTAVDSHVNMPVINADRDRLNHIELVPFKAAIDAGVDSVMTAHIAVPALSPPDVPATLSPPSSPTSSRRTWASKASSSPTPWEMAGIAKGFTTGDAAVRALEAGADVLLMPTDPDAVLKAVTAAVQSGRLTRQRIQESVIKILSAKEKVGLDKKRVVDLEAIGDVVDSPESNEKALEIAEHAVTLVRNTSNMIPLAAPDKACYVIMPENQARLRRPGLHHRTSQDGRARFHQHLGHLIHAPAIGREHRQTRRLRELRGSLVHFRRRHRAPSACSVNCRNGLETLMSSGKPVALIALGNPYVLRNFGGIAAYLATFSNVPPARSLLCAPCSARPQSAASSPSPSPGKPNTATASNSPPPTPCVSRAPSSGSPSRPKKRHFSQSNEGRVNAGN